MLLFVETVWRLPTGVINTIYIFRHTALETLREEIIHCLHGVRNKASSSIAAKKIVEILNAPDTVPVGIHEYSRMNLPVKRLTNLRCCYKINAA